ncbi:MAG: phosphoglycerate kinase, partial [Pseudomonadota bacterium]
MAYKTLDDIDLSSKRVLIRVDINVPVDDGVVTDATRVERILPTVRDVMAKGGKPILLAHFGRPKGRVAPDMSLKVTLGTLAEVLGADIRFSDNCIGEEAVAASNALAPGD